jgi:lysophospholipase L1-like esterase
MKVVLIGDSIRMGYQPVVARKMQGVDVWGPDANCRHSIWALDHFKEWVADQQPDIVHVNFGIHDASPQPDGKHQVILAQYRLGLQRFIAKVAALGKTRMIWATTTPLYIAQAGVPMAQWAIRADAEIEKYNAAALKIVNRRKIPVNDLHAVVMRNDFTRCMSPDGCHMTEFGNEVLSDAVVKAINGPPKAATFLSS